MSSIFDIPEATATAARLHMPSHRSLILHVPRKTRGTQPAIRLLRTALALTAFLSLTATAHARAGRTTAEDCKAGSDDPDCPDTAPAAGKPAQPAKPADPPAPPKN